MSATTCHWTRGCGSTDIHAFGHCSRHYWQLRNAGLIPTILTDATTTRVTIQQHLDRGCRIETLARVSGVTKKTIQRIAGGTKAVHRPTAAKIAATPLRPSNIGCVRRIQALQRIGHSLPAIATAAGYKLTGLNTAFYSGQFADRMAYALDRVYARLQGTRGTSPLATRKAELKGHAAPLAWDGADIDDPDAVPDLGEDTQRSAADTVAEWRHLSACGVRDEDAAERLGVKVATLERNALKLRQREQQATARTGQVAA